MDENTKALLHQIVADYNAKEIVLEIIAKLSERGVSDDKQAAFTRGIDHLNAAAVCFR
jgi:hypothetical protein